MNAPKNYQSASYAKQAAEFERQHGSIATQHDYVVAAKNTVGNALYYTGRAGQDFVSPQLCDAFTYVSQDGANKRAAMLNVGSGLHGLRFEVL